MYLRYGGYTHALNEASISINKVPVMAATGIRLGYTETWDIQGELFADDITALSTMITELEIAYATDGYDLVLLQNDGVTLTPHRLISAFSQNGVRIQDFSYPEGRGGAELNTQRTYRIRASATFILSTGYSFTNWNQQINYLGTGGPRYVVREYRNGPPILQKVSEATPCYATQSGSLESTISGVGPPPPILPGEDEPNRSITYSTRTGTPNLFGCQWSYRFQSPTPF